VNHRFRLGLLTGLTMAAVVIAGKALLTGSQGNLNPEPKQRPLAVAPEVAVLERDLALAREQASAQAAKTGELRSTKSRLGAVLKEIGTENGQLRGQVEQGPAATPERAGTTDPNAAPENLRRKVVAWKDLPPEAAAWVGLNAGQQKLVNDRLKAETAELYSTVRQLASEDPSVPLPAVDGPGLFSALQASPGYSEGFIKETRTVIGDADLRECRKTYYLEDIVDPNSRYFRMEEASFQIRARTLEDLGSFLSGDQQQKMASLLGKGTYRENMLLRRPR
jgi:hypothetical protein